MENVWEHWGPDFGDVFTGPQKGVPTKSSTSCYFYFRGNVMNVSNEDAIVGLIQEV